jgi:hypothetical protein
MTYFMILFHLDGLFYPSVKAFFGDSYGLFVFCALEDSDFEQPVFLLADFYFYDFHDIFGYLLMVAEVKGS